MLKLDFIVNCSQTSPSLRLSYESVFRLFEDAATLDAEQIGYDYGKVGKQGLLWVYTRVYVRFYEMPKYLHKASFETRPGAKKAFIFPRYGRLYDENGKIAADLSSYWCLMDAKSRKAILHPPLESVDHSDGTECPPPGKVEPKEAKEVARHVVAYSDLDLNRHFNNVRYVEMVLSLRPSSFYEKYALNDILISYEAEIHEGDEVILYADDDFTYVRGVVGDRQCFEMNLSFRPL